MLTCLSSLSSPSRYKRQHSDSIQFTSDRACCARESSKFNLHFLAASLWQKLNLVTNSRFRSLYTATFPLIFRGLGESFDSCIVNFFFADGLDRENQFDVWHAEVSAALGHVGE